MEEWVDIKIGLEKLDQNRFKLIFYHPDSTRSVVLSTGTLLSLRRILDSALDQ